MVPPRVAAADRYDQPLRSGAAGARRRAGRPVRNSRCRSAPGWRPAAVRWPQTPRAVTCITPCRRLRSSPRTPRAMAAWSGLITTGSSVPDLRLAVDGWQWAAPDPPMGAPPSPSSLLLRRRMCRRCGFRRSPTEACDLGEDLASAASCGQPAWRRGCVRRSVVVVRRWRVTSIAGLGEGHRARPWLRHMFRAAASCAQASPSLILPLHCPGSSGRGRVGQTSLGQHVPGIGLGRLGVSLSTVRLSQ